MYICPLNVKRCSRLREKFYDGGGKIEKWRNEEKIEEGDKSGEKLF